MDELEFIREYMAVMCCSERSALDVFILHEALMDHGQITWLDGLTVSPMEPHVDQPFSQG